MKMRNHSIRKRLLSVLLIFMLAFSGVITSDLAFGTVNVQAATKKMAISQKKATLCVEKTVKLSIKNATGKVTWSVNKPKIASVNKKGKVIGLKKGTAKVTAKVGKKSYTCTVNVVKHSYSAATCTKAATCKNCKATKGKALGHTANKVTCTEDSVCSRCKAVVEKAKGHDYQVVKCGEPEECSVCHEKSEKIAEHVAKELAATENPCTTDKVCATCGEVIEKAKGHDFKPVKCGEPEVCTVCQEKSDKKAEHVAKVPEKKEDICLKDSVCALCGAVIEKAKGHDFADATCTESKKCKVCGILEGSPLGHDYETRVIPASIEGDGYTEKKCKKCGDIIKSDYVPYVFTEAGVKAVLMAQQSAYPEGTPWTNEGNTYEWHALANTTYTGHGCAAFTIMMSDKAFGTTRAAQKYNLSGLSAETIKNNLRIGDIVRTDHDTHEVIIVDKTDEGIVVAEGNFNNAVHWGRVITYEELSQSAVYYYSRY